MTTKETLSKLVADFRTWLADNFSEEEIKADRVDSPGYNKWREIERNFTTILNNDTISDLDKEDKINLLYLIGRNLDIGNMLAWLSPTAPLSFCGYLRDEDFISLAKVVKDLHKNEFRDAKSQIIVSFQKFPLLTEEIRGILLEIYETGDEYSKRLSLETLAKLNYPEIKSLIERSWHEQNDEYHKMMCLFVINEYLKDFELMRKYLNMAESEQGETISNYIHQLREGAGER